MIIVLISIATPANIKYGQCCYRKLAAKKPAFDQSSKNLSAMDIASNQSVQIYFYVAFIKEQILQGSS
jgi:hypothetical protein